MSHWTDEPKKMMALAPLHLSALQLIEQIAMDGISAALAVEGGDPVGALKAILDAVTAIRNGWSNASSAIDVKGDLENLASKVASNDAAGAAALKAKFPPAT
jgi:hypothetical protein